MEVEGRTVSADPDVAVRVYRPHRARGAVVWLHGGGGVFGDLDTEHPWAARIADLSGAVVVSVGYRLAPEHPFPLDELGLLTLSARQDGRTVVTDEQAGMFAATDDGVLVAGPGARLAATRYEDWLRAVR
ncbi:alpha/beta hydrolase [Streptomyces xanthophaeus]|uniref:Alpha/beta hydrolase fold-3 domain-containing protein n=1 Tax=Streptomyces xanthophaeus TaxID=67385 RepID=A0A919GV18_9ACTN|nr:alpha/beta hydrolase fold domain-containing protein [Streptomyces xanthophaeus]GHI85111.1 hypothetical protein Sxan_24750 [Streptomyces xanthophaeus]